MPHVARFWEGMKVEFPEISITVSLIPVFMTL